MLRHRALIFRLAMKVRKWAERELVSSIDIDTDDLGGACAVCSAELFDLLQERGIDATLIYGDSHVFVVVGEYVIDTTATQFDMRYPLVLIEKWDTLMGREHKGHSPWVQWPWNGQVMTFKSRAALVAWQKESGWPEGQIALEK